MKKNIKVQPEMNEDINYTVRDLDMNEIIPNAIDNFIVTIFENHHTIVLPSHITGIQFKAWSRGRGGVFSKDILNYALKKKSAQYVLIKGNDIHCIARLITEEEKLSFNTLKLVDGQIKDVPYMILKNLKENEKLTNVRKYIEEKDIDIEADTVILAANKNVHDDDADYHVGSISLFTSD
jgi:hypothetical protein